MEEQDELAQANKAVADAQLQWAEHVETKKQTYDKPDGKGFTPSILEEFDKFANPAIESFTSPRARDYVRQHLSALRTNIGKDAIRYEVVTRKAHNDALAAEAFDARGKLLIADPSPENFSRIAAENEAAIDADPYTPAAVKIERKRKQRESLAVAALSLRLEQDAPGLAADLRAAMGIGAKPQALPAQPSSPASADSSFAKMAGEAGLSRDLALLAGAIFEQESKSGAVDTSNSNYAGAIGPMQVLPKTFEGLQKAGAIPADWKVTDPEQNMKAGLALIRQLSDRYNGDQRKIVAAYYSGPKAVREDGSIADLRDPKNAKAPTTLQYVEQVLGRVSGTEIPPAGTPGVDLLVEDITPEDVEKSRKSVADPRIDALSPASLLKIYNSATIAAKQQEAVGKVLFQDRLKDSASRAANGIVDDEPIPDSEFIRYLGPAQGAIAAREYRGAQVFARDVGKLSTMPPESAAALFDARAPKPSSPGFAGDAERFKTMQQAWNEVVRQREEDAGGYVIKHAPTVAKAYRALSEAATPEASREAAEAFAAASIAEQQRLGIQKRAILPKALAEREVANFTKEGSDSMAARIDAAAQTWGRYWPQVYEQLATEFRGSLPDSFLVIPGLQTQAQKEEVARLDNIKLDDLKKQIPASDAGDISKKIGEELQPWAESMLANRTNSDLYQAVMTIAQKMAIARKIRGDGTDKAVAAAVDTVIGQYEFPSTRSQYRYAVPKSENVPMVTAGVQRVVSALPLLNIAPPPYGAGMRNAEELAEEWKGIVTNNPLWVTNADESGLKLFAIGRDGRQYPVNTPSGKQIEYSWADLRAMAEPDPVYSSRGAVGQYQLREQERFRQRQADIERDRSMGVR